MTEDESQHFFKCTTCGKQVDMRNLGEVFSHGVHNPTLNTFECLEVPLDIPFATARRIGDPTEWTKDGKKIDLN